MNTTGAKVLRGRDQSEIIRHERTSFLGDTVRFTMSDASGVSLLRVQFDANAFADDLYSKLGVDLPCELFRSVQKRKAEYLAGRYACQQLLRERHLPTKVETGVHRQPLWPHGWVGSITHTDDVAVAAIAERKSVAALGIDLERWLDDACADRIAMTVVDNFEYSILLSGAYSPSMLMTIAFSCKEAFFKACYPEIGRYFDFDCVKIAGFDWLDGRFTLQVTSALSKKIGSGRLFRGLFLVTASSVFTMIAEAFC